MPYKNPDLQRKYQREWCAKRKAEFLSTLACEKCGNPNKLSLFTNIPGKKVSDMKPWRSSNVPRENYKVICSACKAIPKPRKPRKRKRRKKAPKEKVSEARRMALRAQKMLRQRREKDIK